MTLEEEEHALFEDLWATETRPFLKLLKTAFPKRL
jgi:hypothetical protein